MMDLRFFTILVLKKLGWKKGVEWSAFLLGTTKFYPLQMEDEIERK